MNTTRKPVDPAPQRRLRWMLAGGIAAATMIAVSAVLSRRPQVVEPVRTGPVTAPRPGATIPARPVPTAAGSRNGHGPA